MFPSVIRNVAMSLSPACLQPWPGDTSYQITLTVTAAGRCPLLVNEGKEQSCSCQRPDKNFEFIH